MDVRGCLALWVRTHPDPDGVYDSIRSGTPCGRKAVYEVTFSDSGHLLCCKYHLFRVTRGLFRFGIKFKWKKIRMRRVA